MDVAFYSEKQLDKITSLSRMTRWRMRRLGTFPNPVHISAGRVGYPAKAIDEWINGCAAQKESAA